MESAAVRQIPLNGWTKDGQERIQPPSRETRSQFNMGGCTNKMSA